MFPSGPVKRTATFIGKVSLKVMLRVTEQVRMISVPGNIGLDISQVTVTHVGLGTKDDNYDNNIVFILWDGSK